MSAREACRWDWMAGLATATIVPSRATIITPSATASSVSGGLPRQRRGPRRAPRAGAAVTAALAATAGLPVPALLAGAAGLPVPAVLAGAAGLPVAAALAGAAGLPVAAALAGAAGLPLAVRGAAGAVVPVIGFSFMPVAGPRPPC